MIDEKKLIEEIEKEIDGVIVKDTYSKGKNAGLRKARILAEEQPKIGGWIPCSEHLPVTEEYMGFEPTPYMKRLEIAYMTDTVEYLIGHYDGSKWMDKHHNIIKNVIAWKPFLNLPEAYHGQMD